MNPDLTAAYQALEMAQQARKAGDKLRARQFAEQAANLAPELEEVWLMMAALASPRASIVFLEKALAINPHSERARQGMHWAVDRLRREAPHNAAPARAAAPGVGTARKSAAKARFSYAAVLLAVVCLVAGWAVWSVTPAAAAYINNSLFSNPKNQPSWAPVDEVKPTYTPAPSATLAASETPPATGTMVPTATATATATATETPVDTATPQPTDTPTGTPTEAGPSPTPLPTDTAFPTLTSLPTDAPGAAATKAVPAVPLPASGGNGGTRWIDVDLTHQMVYAYEGQSVVNSFLVSTGTWQHPTVTGQYHIYVKYRYANMSGPGYFLPNVPYTMYFYKGYGLHGTYWHSNFGTPMSHGCVNLSIPDAGWLYNWASVGTLVNVHY
jgi:lipoprotein-anchoring transpeptidase ErfK/SrfK